MRTAHLDPTGVTAGSQPNGLVLRSDPVLFRFVAHDGSEGLSPDGWLPDRISVGVLTRVFTPELVDAAVEEAGARELRRRLLPARLVVYFTLALWLFRGRNCGYGQVMTKLADGLYHQRRAADLLEGHLDPGGWVDAGEGRRWRQPNISSLSRGRGKLGPARCTTCSCRSRARPGRWRIRGCPAAGCGSSRSTAR